MRHCRPKVQLWRVASSLRECQHYLVSWQSLLGLELHGIITANGVLDKLQVRAMSRKYSYKMCTKYQIWRPIAVAYVDAVTAPNLHCRLVEHDQTLTASFFACCLVCAELQNNHDSLIMVVMPPQLETPNVWRQS